MRPLASTTPLALALQAFRGRLAFTYSLFALEMTASLLRPFFLGRAIDGLLSQSYRGLIELSVAHLVFLIIGSARHMVDTRTFSAVYQSFVTSFMTRPGNTSTVSRRSAHSTLARQIVDFLEYDFNHVVEALYNVVGSLVLLYFYNHTIVWICLAVLLPVMIIARGYGRRTVRLNVAHHDELERQVDIIQDGDTAGISGHYEKLRGWQVRLSDQEAWNFGVTELLVLFAIAGSLIVSTQVGEAALQVGSLVGVYTYMLKFAAGLETIPYTVQRIGALRDIMRRMTSVETVDPVPM